MHDESGRGATLRRARAASGRRPGCGIHRRRLIRALVREDGGSASLEFITVGLLMLIPLVYLVVALGTIQGQSLGVDAAARHTARAISLASDSDAAGQRADAVLTTVAAEYGIEPGELHVAVSCLPLASPCPSAGATVMVTVSTRVKLPLVPALLGLDRIASVSVEAASAQKVSRFWGVQP